MLSTKLLPPGVRTLRSALLLVGLPVLIITWLLGNWQYNRVKTWWEFEDYFDDGASAGDKVIVMAKLEKENTNWVEENLPDWQRAIYTVDNPSSSELRTPANKGHESMAYLTYIIDNYDTLPSTIVFLHSHEKGYWKGWHTDTWLYDNVRSVRALRLPYVQQSGYVNLRCSWQPGCKPSHRHNEHVTPQVWREIFEKGDDLPVPTEIGAACCAQFAVSRDQVRVRPKSDYVHFREWVLETELEDAKSGRVMEFLWHIIFGKDPVHCPDPKECYCKVYGRCND